MPCATPLPHVRAAAVSAPRDEEVFFLRPQASGGVGIIEAILLVSVKYTDAI